MAFKTVFSFLDIGRSLCHKDTGNVDGISGRRMNATKVRDKPSVNCGIGEMAFHHGEFALGITFLPVKLNLLAFYRFEFTLMCPISIDISDNTGVFEIYDGVVDEKSRCGGRMKDIEVIIFDPRTIEVWSRMCSHMKRDRILGIALLMSPYKVSIHTNLSKSDVMCHLILTILVEENKGVLPRITAVILAPPVPWMIRVIELLGKLGNIGDGARCGRKRDGRVVLSEPDWFVALHVVI